MNYIEGRFKEIYDFISSRTAGDDVISDAVRENPFQDQLSYNRQLVVQDKKAFAGYTPAKLKKNGFTCFNSTSAWSRFRSTS